MYTSVGTKQTNTLTLAIKNQEANYPFRNIKKIKNYCSVLRYVAGNHLCSFFFFFLILISSTSIITQYRNKIKKEMNSNYIIGYIIAIIYCACSYVVLSIINTDRRKWCSTTRTQRRKSRKSIVSIYADRSYDQDKCTSLTR